MPGPSRRIDLCLPCCRNRPVALDAATGEVVTRFGDMEKPTTVIFDGSRVIAADTDYSFAPSMSRPGNRSGGFAAADPRNVIADGKIATFLHGRIRRGDKAEAVALDAATGVVKWRRDNDPWLAHATRTVLAKGQLAFEVSTLNDDDAGNGIHVVSASTGEHRWSKEFPPGMNHRRQARAMFLENDLWILHGGKINTSDQENRKRQPVQVSALDPFTGKTRVTYPAGMTHCFPAGLHAELHVCGRIGLDGPEVWRRDCESNHQGKLLEREWLGAGQRSGLHDTEALHLLAYAARLCGDGASARKAITCEPAGGPNRIRIRKGDQPSTIPKPRIRNLTIGHCTVTTVGAAAARWRRDRSRWGSVGAPH